MKVCVDHTKAALTESMLIEKKVKLSKNDTSSTVDSTAMCEDEGGIFEFEDSKLPPFPVTTTLKKKRSSKLSNENIGRSENVKNVLLLRSRVLIVMIHMNHHNHYYK